MSDSCRILLVEDDEDDSHLLTRYFERAGYRPIVHRVETADEMRRALNQPDAEWDVVLADFNLPSFSAPAALRPAAERLFPARSEHSCGQPATPRLGPPTPSSGHEAL